MGQFDIAAFPPSPTAQEMEALRGDEATPALASDRLESALLPHQQSTRRRRLSVALGVAATATALLGLATVASSSLRGAKTMRDASGGELTRLDEAEPAPAPPPPAISLFCFSIMKPNSNEQTLMEFALKKRTSIFKCDEFAVISSEKVNLGPGDDGDVHTWFEPTPTVGTGQLGSNGVTTNSFLNTYSFIIAWDSLIKSKKLEKHDFIIKVDPDAVFLPDRLQPHVIAHKGKAVFFPNCNLWPASPPVGPKMYGALEVYSWQAIQMYAANPDKCKNMNWHGWGEDYYMQECMLVLGVQEVADYQLVGDHRCIYAPCTDGYRVAFHDFKDIKSYDECFEAAISR